MRSSATSVLGLVLAAAVSLAQPASAQQGRLGPVDGRDLAPADTGRVAVGDMAPDFVLDTYDDGILQLSEFRGKKDIVLVFYRGYW